MFASSVVQADAYCGPYHRNAYASADSLSAPSGRNWS